MIGRFALGSENAISSKITNIKRRDAEVSVPEPKDRLRKSKFGTCILWRGFVAVSSTVDHLNDYFTLRSFHKTTKYYVVNSNIIRNIFVLFCSAAYTSTVVLILLAADSQKEF